MRVGFGDLMNMKVVEHESLLPEWTRTLDFDVMNSGYDHWKLGYRICPGLVARDSMV